ncbi:hypothetical protein SK128_003220, partial [Halocaridina rubra]
MCVTQISMAGHQKRSKSNMSPLSATPLQMRALAMMALILVSLADEAVGAAAGDRKIAESPRMITCPSSHEIHPCTCRVMSKGLDIVCDHIDEKHVHSALDVLKKKPFIIYWMKFRNCNLPRIPDYIFLGLDVRHLNIIRSNVSAIDRSSLSALGSNLQSLDLATNNIRE